MPRRILCNILAAAFSLLVILPFTMMLFDREPPIVLRDGKVETEIVQGMIATTITWNAIRNRKFGDGLFDCQGTVSRRITDSGGFVIETKAEPVISYKLLGKTHVSGTFTKQFMLPHMLPGNATYQVTTTYWCNPVQKYIYQIIHTEDAVHFIVGEPKSSGQSTP